MTDDEMIKITNAVTEGIRIGLEHTSPSTQTRNHMEDTKMELAIMKKDIELLQKEIEHNTKTLDTMLASQKEFINSADDKYASKEFEVGIKKVNWLVISTLVITILAFIIKQA